MADLSPVAAVLARVQLGHADEPEIAESIEGVLAENRALRGVMAQLRAEAASAEPGCVNLAHIDRLWASVGLSPL